MEIWRFALIGLGLGGLYAISAQGIVLIYRASGVVNFAQGAFVMVGGYAFYEFSEIHGIPSLVSLFLVLVVGAILGLAVHYLLMRPLRNASPLARVVATLGVLAVLQAVAVIWFGTDVLSVPSALPSESIHFAGVTITEDNLILLGIGVVVTAVLWFVYRFTKFGQVTTAVAENERAASALGHSPGTIAAVNWVVGAVLATGAGALIAPITYLEPTILDQVVLPAIAAALLGAFASFPLAMIAALVIGAAQSVTTYLTTVNNWWSGWSESIPFIIVILYLVLRGTSIPLRGHIFDRLPMVGTGRIRIVPTVIMTAAAIVVMVVLPVNWAIAFTVTICYAIVCLSVVVVTGYAGQLSLAQYVIGATGAFVGAKLMQEVHGIPFDVAFVISVGVSALIGLAVGAPAIRTRGVNLAIVTLGMAVTMYALFLTNIQLAGGVDGIPIEPARFLWLDLNPSTHPARYGIAAIIVTLILALMVANLRRGKAGRRLLAVRSNERAALSLGVSVFQAKLYSFVVGSAIAGIGVCILAFINPSVVFSQFDVFSSISFVTSTVVGGIGMLGGGLTGSVLVDGGITSRFLSSLGATVDTWLPLIGGVAVLLTLISAQDGVFELYRAAGVMTRERITDWRQRRSRVQASASARAGPSAGDARDLEFIAVTAGETPERAVQSIGGKRSTNFAPTIPRKELVVRDLTVRFGGVTAVDTMSISVRPGTVHGLIGPNGAGKTTFIDAVTGFVKVNGGSIELDGVSLRRLGARQRARLGLGRSFQSSELFSELTIRENLAIGSDQSGWRSYLTDPFWPGRIQLSTAAMTAAHELELDDVLDRRPESLPFGRRRMVAIARSVAAGPSVLLLDEPAAGLDTGAAEDLAHLIRQLADSWQIGVLLVEHNLDMVLSVCDEITVMASGAELLPASHPETVRTHPAVIAAYVGAVGAATAGISKVEG